MRTFTLLATVLALVLAGCGGDDEESGGAATPSPAAQSTPEPGSGGGGQQIALAAPADGSKVFEPAELTAEAGAVTVDFDNPSQVPHAVEIEGNGVEEVSDTVTAGEASVTAELEPGEYTFYCPVGDHRAEGMEGTLTVE